MRKGYRILLAVGVALILSAGLAQAQAFNFVEEFPLNPLPPGMGVHGIAKVGDTWCIANFSGGWNVYDASFNQTGVVVTSPPTGETRGIVYNSNSGTIFLGEYSAGVIHECTTDGTILNSFSSAGGGGFNALAYDPNTDHLFAVHFPGPVVVMTSAGAVLDTWTATGFSWTGAAYDWHMNTLLLMTSSNDLIKEYTPDGTLLDTPLNSDCVSGNGQGLFYDSLTGTLYCTSQAGNIAVWDRPVVTATAETSWGALKSLY